MTLSIPPKKKKKGLLLVYKTKISTTRYTSHIKFFDKELGMSELCDSLSMFNGLTTRK